MMKKYFLKALGVFAMLCSCALAQEMSSNVPIEFFGEVVNQRGEPVADCIVDFEVTYYSDTILNGRKLHKKISSPSTSSKDGRVEVRGKSGSALFVKGIRTNRGMLSTKNLNAFYFGSQHAQPHKPDIANPVVFKIWERTPKATPLLARKKVQLDVQVGTEIKIDALTGDLGTANLLNSVILKIDLVKGAENSTIHGKDWFVRILVPIGGVHPEDGFMLEAPAQGYQSEFILRPNLEESSGSIKPTDLFISLGNGRVFGKMTVGVTLDTSFQEPALVSLEFVTNSNGGRDLDDVFY